MTNFQDASQISIEVKIRQVMDFMRKHIQRVGTEQAIKDFQYGLNILNMKRKNSSIEEFHQLKEDGDFGNKTYSCIANLCKYFSPRIICRNIKKAAITNAIFNTKNNKRIDTENKLEQINRDMQIEGVV
ncbi:unknown [Clostridium sp. CAG:967]|nr:unknown [Clostridium sp. CAG:967]